MQEVSRGWRSLKAIEGGGGGGGGGGDSAGGKQRLEVSEGH